VSGGQAYGASLGSYMVSPISLQYNLVATQNGLSTAGSATIQFSGTVANGDSTLPTGTPIGISGHFNVNNNVNVGAQVGNT